MFNLNRKRFAVLAVVAVLFALFGGSAQAAIDTAISGAVTDVSGLWDTIKALLIAVTIAIIAIAYLRKLKR